MKNGFTLIELLVVVLIIGILSSIALPQYERAVEKSRAAEALVTGKSILDAMNRAINERPNESPNTRASLDIRLSGGKWNASTNGYQTKFFFYDLSKGDRVEAVRDLGDDGKYTLTFYNTLSASSDKKTCTATGRIGQGVCQSLKSLGYES